MSENEAKNAAQSREVSEDVLRYIGRKREWLRSYEIKLILKALEKTGGHQSEAAKLLNMPRRTLVHKMKAYGIRKRFGK